MRRGLGRAFGVELPTRRNEWRLARSPTERCWKRLRSDRRILLRSRTPRGLAMSLETMARCDKRIILLIRCKIVQLKCRQTSAIESNESKSASDYDSAAPLTETSVYGCCQSHVFIAHFAVWVDMSGEDRDPGTTILQSNRRGAPLLAPTGGAFFGGNEQRTKLHCRRDRARSVKLNEEIP